MEKKDAAGCQETLVEVWQKVKRRIKKLGQPVARSGCNEESCDVTDQATD